MERLDFGSIGGRPLGKDSDALSTGEALHDRAVDARRIVPLAAFDKNRPGPRCQPAYYWPAPDIGLGDQAQRAHGLQYPDVQPGYVIAHDDRGGVRRGCAPHYVYTHVQDVKNPARPTLDDPNLVRPGNKGKHQRLRRAAVEEVGNQPGEAIGSGRSGRLPGVPLRQHAS
jgi:hypothetical protein